MKQSDSGCSRLRATWQIAAFAGPLILQNLAYVLHGVIDTYFVSRVGTDQLAAVGVAGVIFMMAAAFYKGVMGSTIVLVARAYGESDFPKIGCDIWRILNVLFWMSLTVVALPLAFSWLMRVVVPGDQGVVRLLGIKYLQLRSIELPATMFTTVVYGFLVAQGDSRTPMQLAWATVLLNALLDWVLVLGNLGCPPLGVSGAAAATVLANLISAVASGLILWRLENRRKFGTGQRRIASVPELKGVLRIGIPMGVAEFVEIAAFCVFVAMVAQLGTEVLAANQIAIQFMSMTLAVSLAVGTATSSLVGQKLGAGKPMLAESVAAGSVTLAVVCMSVCSFWFLIAPEPLMRIFNGDAKVVSAGCSILGFIAVYQVVEAVGIVFGSALNGAGDTTFTMFTRLLLGWGLLIPMAYVFVFPMEMGAQGAWAASVIYSMLAAFVYFFRWRSGRWQHIELN